MKVFKKIASQSLLYALADFLVKSANLILTPYYIYKLTIAQFGQFGIIVSILAVGQVFFNVGFQSGLVRYYYLREPNRKAYISSSFFYLLLLSIISIPVVYYIILLIDIFELVDSGEVLKIVISSALYGIIINNAIALLKVQEKPIFSGILGITSSITILLTTIYFIENEVFDPIVSIVNGQLIGIGVGSIVSIYFLKNLLTLKISIIYFMEILKYSVPLTFHNTFQWILNNIDRLILIKILGPEKLGGYYFAYQFSTLTKIILRSINSSLLSVFSQLAAKKIDVQIVRKINHLYILFTLALVIIISIVSPLLISYLNLNEYSPFLYLLPMLIASGGFYGLYYIPMNILTLTLGKSRHVYIITLIAAVLNTVINLLFISYGVHIAALANILSYFTLLLGFLIIVGKFDIYKKVINEKKMIYALTIIIIFTIVSTYLNL